MAYVLHHKLSTFSWCCLLPGGLVLFLAQNPFFHVVPGQQCPGVKGLILCHGPLMLDCISFCYHRIGAGSPTTISLDCLNIMSNLTLAHLFSSVSLVIGSEITLFPYSPIMLRHLGNPSHFLMCELIKQSSLLTCERVTL